MGRAGFPDWQRVGLEARYSLLTWPGLAAAYLAWVRMGGPGGRWVPVGLCAAAALAFPFNTAVGLARGTNAKGWMNRLEADVRAGRPAADAARDYPYEPGQEELAVRGMPMLRDAGVGFFVHLRDPKPGN
jgi:hypothetical protein